MRVIIRTHLIVLTQLLLVAPTSAEEIGPGISIDFRGALHEPADISGIARVGEFLVIASDEGQVVQVLKKVNDAEYQLTHKYHLPSGTLTNETQAGDGEIDFEGVAASGETVYVTGSHARTRSRVKADDEDQRTYATNRERLTSNKSEMSRRAIFRFKLDANGNLQGDVHQQADLHEFLQETPPFDDFTRLPSKENGIDIEGIAADGETILVGFRGPVIRENWVPVLAFDFDEDLKSVNPNVELSYVNLGGLGIRDIARVSNGYLLIAGPHGDGPGEYQLYHWDGNDTVPGAGSPGGKVTRLGKIPTDEGAKAEGIVVIEETATRYVAIIVWDSVTNGAPKRFEIAK